LELIQVSSGRIKGVVRKWLHAGRPYLAKKGVVLQMAVIGAEDAFCS
jgi:hypothetical protein